MNLKLLNAECEVRKGSWGNDIGGLQEEKENIADLLKRLESQKSSKISKDETEKGGDRK